MILSFVYFYDKHFQSVALNAALMLYSPSRKTLKVLLHLLGQVEVPIYQYDLYTSVLSPYRPQLPVRWKLLAQ